MNGCDSMICIWNWSCTLRTKWVNMYIIIQFLSKKMSGRLWSKFMTKFDTYTSKTLRIFRGMVKYWPQALLILDRVYPCQMFPQSLVERQLLILSFHFARFLEKFYSPKKIPSYKNRKIIELLIWNVKRFIS